MSECAVPGCDGRPTNADGFLCRPHWYKVPKAQRDRVWALFRSEPGSPAHRRAVWDAIHVAQKRG